MRRTLLAFACGLFVLTAPATHAQQSWSAVNAGWRVSCGVDSGSHTSSGGTHTFRPSSNRCSGGFYQQRAELTSRTFNVRDRQRLLFETTVQMRAAGSGEFTLFQIHSEDSREGCAPPVAMNVRGNGSFEFFSDYSRSSGSNFCVPNNSLRAARHSGPRFQRNGTPQKLQVVLEFDGSGGFTLIALLDDRQVITGRYAPNTSEGYVPLRSIYLKHGVYSEHRWDYEMQSAGLSLRQQRL